MIYKMPHPLWEQLFELFELLSDEDVPYIDMERYQQDMNYEPIEEYIQYEFGLKYTGKWDKVTDDNGDNIDELETYHYLVTDPKKFLIYLLKWG